MNRKELVEQGLKEFGISENFREFTEWLCYNSMRMNLQIATDDELREECKKRNINVVPKNCGIYAFD